MCTSYAERTNREDANGKQRAKDYKMDQAYLKRSQKEFVKVKNKITEIQICAVAFSADLYR